MPEGVALPGRISSGYRLICDALRHVTPLNRITPRPGYPHLCQLYVWGCLPTAFMLWPTALRLARAWGPIKLQRSECRAAGGQRRKRPIWLLCKPLFHFHTSPCLAPFWYFTGFWPPFKCEHNTAIEIMPRTSWLEQGSALALAPGANTSCSVCQNYAILFFTLLNFWCGSGGCTVRLCTSTNTSE